MAMQRLLFNVSTDTGRAVYTSAPIFGGLIQQRWVPDTADTGGDLKLTLLYKAGSDTGDGWAFYNNNDCLGAQFTDVPSQHVHDGDGLDTGNDGMAAIAFAGESLKVEVTPGGAAVVGRLYYTISTE